MNRGIDIYKPSPGVDAYDTLQNEALSTSGVVTEQRGCEGSSCSRVVVTHPTYTC